MKFLTFFFTAILPAFLLFAQDSFAQDQSCSDVDSYLVFDEKDGEILFEKRSQDVVYPASLVKLMTLYLTFDAIEHGKLNPKTVLIISERGEEVSAVNKNNSLHLKEGDKITVREAIQGVIVKSYNEAAVTLAEAISGSEWDFVRKMNETAKKLGMINTSFSNASGLHEEGQYTTSYDLARLTRAIKHDFPGYYHLFALKQFTYNKMKYQTHNHVLVDYKGAEGLKTGFTKASGFNLISAAKKNDSRIISILLGCATYQKRDELTKELFNQAFQRLIQEKKESKKQEIKVVLSKNFDYQLVSEKEKDEEKYEEEIRLGEALIGSEN